KIRIRCRSFECSRPYIGHPGGAGPTCGSLCYNRREQPRAEDRRGPGARAPGCASTVFPKRSGRRLRACGRIAGDMMQDSASQAMRPPSAESAEVAAPELAFADSDSAKRWVKSLLITAVTPLYEAVHGQLRALSAADFAPRERATIAEVMR